MATLRAATIHGMTPIVVTARFDPNEVLSYNAATDPQIQNFKFTDATHGVRYAHPLLQIPCSVRTMGSGLEWAAWSRMRPGIIS